MEDNFLISDSILLLGFTLAHAAWSIAEAEVKELLCPLAFIERDGNLELLRFESEVQEDAISMGKDYIDLHKENAIVISFAREELLTEQYKKVDVLLVECWAKHETEHYGVIQKFMPNEGKGKFRLLGDPIILIDGLTQTEGTVTKLKERLEQGIQSHSEVAQLWSQWKV